MVSNKLIAPAQSKVYDGSQQEGAEGLWTNGYLYSGVVFQMKTGTMSCGDGTDPKAPYTQYVTAHIGSNYNPPSPVGSTEIGVAKFSSSPNVYKVYVFDNDIGGFQWIANYADSSFPETYHSYEINITNIIDGSAGYRYYVFYDYQLVCEGHLPLRSVNQVSQCKEAFRNNVQGAYWIPEASPTIFRNVGLYYVDGSGKFNIIGWNSNVPTHLVESAGFTDSYPGYPPNYQSIQITSAATN
jgi:hypothetical protein